MPLARCVRTAFSDRSGNSVSSERLTMRKANTGNANVLSAGETCVMRCSTSENAARRIRIEDDETHDPACLS
jgi:hypothetical protein